MAIQQPWVEFVNNKNILKKKSKIKFKKNIYYHDRILKDSYFRNKIIK